MVIAEAHNVEKNEGRPPGSGRVKRIRPELSEPSL